MFESVQPAVWAREEFGGSRYQGCVASIHRDFDSVVIKMMQASL